MDILGWEILLAIAVAYIWFGLKRRRERASFTDKAVTVAAIITLAVAAMLGH